MIQNGLPGREPPPRRADDSDSMESALKVKYMRDFWPEKESTRTRGNRVGKKKETRARRPSGQNRTN